MSDEKLGNSPNQPESKSEDIQVTWLNWVRGVGFLGLLFGMIFNGPVATVVEEFVSYQFVRTYAGGIVTGIVAGGMIGLTLGAVVGGIAQSIARIQKSPKKKVPTGMPKILIVEDHSPTGTMIQISLERSGYEITQVSNGEDALAAVSAQPFDLIVLDIAMPGMSGIEICRTIRGKKLSDAPIIMFTATASLEAKLAAFDAGANDFLTKPAHIEEFHARVNALLRRATPPKPAETAPVKVKAETDKQENKGDPESSPEPQKTLTPLRQRLQNMRNSAESTQEKPMPSSPATGGLDDVKSDIASKGPASSSSTEEVSVDSSAPQEAKKGEIPQKPDCSKDGDPPQAVVEPQTGDLNRKKEGAGTEAEKPESRSASQSSRTSQNGSLSKNGSEGSKRPESSDT